MSLFRPLQPTLKSTLMCNITVRTEQDYDFHIQKEQKCYLYFYIIFYITDCIRIVRCVAVVLWSLMEVHNLIFNECI